MIVAEGTEVDMDLFEVACILDGRIKVPRRILMLRSVCSNKESEVVLRIGNSKSCLERRIEYRCSV